MAETKLRLLESHKKAIDEHLLSQPEQEVCGLIGGTWQPSNQLAVARAVIPIANVDVHPAVRYTMSPREQIAAMLHFEKQGWELIGIYHSHPHGEAIPSATDISEARYPTAIYLIGIPGGDLTAWRIGKGEIRAVELEIIAGTE